MLHRFAHDISSIEPPRQFTWPFHYTPHPLCRMAAAEVEEYLRSRHDWAEEIARGKMFGVLVVRDCDESLGFVAAFSGNLAGSNHHDYFTPPVYDMLQPDDLFRREEAAISAINRHIAQLEQSDDYTSSQRHLEQVRMQAERELSSLKTTLQQRKAERKVRRAEGEDEAQLILESQRDNADLQRVKRHHRELVAQAEQAVERLHAEIAALGDERRRRSAALQQALFRKFRMLNALGESRDLCELFAPTSQPLPPAGAGECAAPKMLQYAYLHSLTPIAMAEFWQGASPRGEVRHHGQFYPSCNGKCKPILTFMMQGLDVEPNPLLAIRPMEPTIVWEDENLVAVNKPCGMLSVRGKSNVRSVEEWAEEHYPDYTGPRMVHRLDQSTSGLLLVAKNKAAHQALQEQFIKHTIKKSYIALLDGEVGRESGRIDLPIKLDYDNRPRQMVASDGKRAITEYEVVAIERGKEHPHPRTRIIFHPITGRTHQLRLHAAHHEGLNTPIVGDDIYGHDCRADLCDGHRLCLHAQSIEFTHPRTGQHIELRCDAEF